MSSIYAGKLKKYKLDFYVTTLDGDRSASAFSDFLDSATDGYTPAMPLEPADTEQFQVRSLERINKGRVIKGVFGRCQYGEAPVQGNSSGAEAEVELKPGHGLVQKNFFLFYRRNNLLVYQRNSAGSHIAKFQKYVNLSAGKGSAFEPILTTDSYQRLIEGGSAKAVEFSFQAPKDPGVYADIATSDAVKLLKRFNGLNTRMVFTVGRSRGRLQQAKEAAIFLAKSGMARVARIKLEDETEAIDLIADRVIETIAVPLQLNGRPNPADIYAAIEAAKSLREDDLKVFFGE